MLKDCRQLHHKEGDYLILHSMPIKCVQIKDRTPTPCLWFSCRILHFRFILKQVFTATWLACQGPLGLKTATTNIKVTETTHSLWQKHIWLSIVWSYFAQQPIRGAWEDEVVSQFTCDPIGQHSLCAEQQFDLPASPPECVERAVPLEGLRAVLCIVCVFVSVLPLKGLISGDQIWQSQQVMTEAVVRSHPEPQRRPSLHGKQKAGPHVNSWDILS